MELSKLYLTKLKISTFNLARKVCGVISTYLN